jgi:hypothetical protein
MQGDSPILFSSVVVRDTHFQNQLYTRYIHDRQLFSHVTCNVKHRYSECNWLFCSRDRIFFFLLLDQRSPIECAELACGLAKVVVVLQCCLNSPRAEESGTSPMVVVGLEAEIDHRQYICLKHY